MASVSLPLILTDVTGGDRQMEVAGDTLAEIVSALELLYPGIEARICQGEAIRHTLAFVVDGKIAARGLQTPVSPQSEINVLPAMGGG